MGAVSTEYAEPFGYSREERLAYAGHQMCAVGRTVLDKYVEISDSEIAAEAKDTAALLARTVLDSMQTSHKLFDEIVKAPKTAEPEYKDNLLQFPRKQEDRVVPQYPEFATVEAARQDATVFESLLARFAPMINKIASGYFLQTGGDHDDLRQEATIGFFKSVRDYDGIQSSFEAFASLCIRAQVITAVKTSTRLKHGLINEALSFEFVTPGQEGSDLTIGDTLSGREPSVERQALSNLAIPGLVEFINTRLSPFESDVFKMFFNGESYEFIAQELGVDPKNVDNAIQRYRRKIQAYLSAPEKITPEPDVKEPEPIRRNAAAVKAKRVRRKVEKPPKPERPKLGLEIDGVPIDDDTLFFIGSKERFILEYLARSQAASIARKDILSAGFYPQGKTDGARYQAFQNAVGNLCDNLRTADGQAVLEAQGIKAGRKYLLRSALRLNSDPIFNISLPETEAPGQETTAQPKQVKVKTERSEVKAKPKPKVEAKRPRRIYESTMTSAEFWKSPIPKEKPSSSFRSATREAKPIPEPVDTGVEMIEGKEYKVVVLPGYQGRPAPLPEKSIKIGDHQITRDGSIINLRQAAEY